MNRRQFLVLGGLVILNTSCVTTKDKVADSKYKACLTAVHNRGVPPEDFLNELVKWARQAPDTIFQVNDRHDIYSLLQSQLGPWSGITHRKAVMLEALRVLGGFESSWNWSEGRDTTNPNIDTPLNEEAGIFQCSADSMSFGEDLKQLLKSACGSTDSESFITTSKTNKQFAIEYCARLLRYTIRHHGPLKHKHVNGWVRRDCVSEFQRLIEGK